MASQPTSLSEREERFGEIAFAYLREREEGRRPDPREWLARYPEFAPELASFFADQSEVDRLGAPLREMAGAVERPSTVAQDDSAGPDKCPAAFGDYEVLGEMARGGMGVVYRARQRGLNRLVALKVVRAGEWASAEEVRRFRNEAEMVALLDHPNVVPVHEVGEQAGQLYFSMKLVEGGSLAQHPGRYRGDPRAAAALLATVARAVHHAHQRGVLHRDLKPSNILLDEDGRPHVTDFGLARRVEADSSLTQSGAIVGTPSYMAPEQATGEKGAVTTATDVYGLGAVLYALLTGRPPFQAESVLETLVQVREREPEPPSGVNRRVPRDLETICLKCLAKEPRRRYVSALALAEDLDRFHAGEPIQARPVGVWERGVKWAGRHRPLVVAGMASLLLALLVLGVSNVLIWRAQQEAKQNEKAANLHNEEVNNLVAVMSEQRDRLEGKSQKALRAMDRVLAEEEKNGPLPPGLSEQAIQFYEDILPLGSNQIPMQLEEAWAHVRLGSLHATRDQFDKALGSYLQAEHLVRQAGSITPADADREQHLKSLQPPPTVEAAFSRALAHWRKTAGGWENVKDYRLATLSAGPGAAHPSKPWDFPRADRVYREEGRLRECVLADLPTVEHLVELVSLHVSYGQYLKEIGHAEDARAAYLRALECWEKWEPSLRAANNGSGTLVASLDVLGKSGDIVRVDHGSVVGLPANLGGRFRDLGAPQEAERAYRAACQIGTKLIGNLSDGEFLQALFRCYEQYAHFLEGAGRPEDARGVFRRALAERERRLAELPAGAITGAPADDLVRLGASLANLKAPEDAERAFRAALGIYERLRREQADKPTYSYELASCHIELGYLLREGREKRAEYVTAARFYTEAIAAVKPEQVECLPFAHHRYNAACAAALASCGPGGDAVRLDDDDCARLRGQALDWLRLDLEAWQRLLERDSGWMPLPDAPFSAVTQVEPEKVRSLVASEMQHWLADADFAGVRGPEALARLPEAERQPWQKLWADVADTLARAENKDTPEKKSPTK